MSWRETLGVSDPIGIPHAQNPHNPQNPVNQRHCADTANTAHEDHKNGNYRLQEALEEACQGLPVSPRVLREALSPEDIKDWLKGDISRDTISAFARSLVQRREMEQGKVPEHYTKHATCKQCGPIWLWFSGEVLGCPWCWNRVAGKPIPRPPSKSDP